MRVCELDVVDSILGQMHQRWWSKGVHSDGPQENYTYRRPFYNRIDSTERVFSNIYIKSYQNHIKINLKNIYKTWYDTNTMVNII